jgi:hypothetical protein
MERDRAADIGTWHARIKFLSGGSAKPAYFNRLTAHDAVQIAAQKKSHKIAALHKSIVFPRVFRLQFQSCPGRGAAWLRSHALSGGTKWQRMTGRRL